MSEPTTKTPAPEGKPIVSADVLQESALECKNLALAASALARRERERAQVLRYMVTPTTTWEEAVRAFRATNQPPREDSHV